MHLLTQLFALVCYIYDYFNTTMYCGCQLVGSALYRYIPQEFVDILNVTYTWYKFDCAPKLNGILPRFFMLADMEDLSNIFLR